MFQNLYENKIHTHARALPTSVWVISLIMILFFYASATAAVIH